MKSQTIFLIVLMILFGSSCKKGNEPAIDPSISSTCNLECITRTSLKGNEPTSDKSCIHWSFDGDKTLSLTHYNAGFNCCPVDVLVNLEIKGDSLIITEDDAEELCRCNCLYDVEISITDLIKKNWVISVVEPYLTGTDARLEFSVELSGPSSGEVCVVRDFYPWGI